MTHAHEFLQEQEPFVGHQQWRWLRTIFVFLVAALGVWALVVMVAAVNTTSRLLDARGMVQQAKQEAVALSFDDAATSLHEAKERLSSARRALPVVRSVAWLPFAGAPVDSFANVVDGMDAVIMAVEPMMALGGELIRLSGLGEASLEQAREGLDFGATFDDLSTDTKRAVLRRLSASANDLDLLVAQISILQEELSLARRAHGIAALDVLLDPLARDLETIGEPLRLLAVVARLLPSFGGLDEPSSMLLLFLNNDELRPGGGFIGAYGLLEMSGGDIEQLSTADVYALDDAVTSAPVRPAPEPLVRYNAADRWYLRDSNWSPDFAASSRQAIELFLEEAASLPEGSSPPVTDQIDHVVGFTPTYAADLLAITGPITVGGQTFTSQNVADLLEYQVEFGFARDGLPLSQRKEILADLVNEMKSRLYALPVAQWSAVVDASRKGLTQKQLLLYSTDASVQEVLTRAGWAGAIVPRTADALMVVDANLASLKSDPAVSRAITYEAFPNSSGQWIGRVSIAYDHRGTFDWKTTRYRTYTRVYVPAGSELLVVSGNWLNDKTQNPARALGTVDTVEELGLVSFGTFTSVEPGLQQTLIFEFALSPDVADAIMSSVYDLTVFKQAGARSNALTIDLDFDKKLSHASPAEDPAEWGDDVYRLNTILDQDLIINVRP